MTFIESFARLRVWQQFLIVYDIFRLCQVNKDSYVRIWEQVVCQDNEIIIRLFKIIKIKYFAFFIKKWKNKWISSLEINSRTCKLLLKILEANIKSKNWVFKINKLFSYSSIKEIPKYVEHLHFKMEKTKDQDYRPISKSTIINHKIQLTMQVELQWFTMEIQNWKLAHMQAWFSCIWLCRNTKKIQAHVKNPVNLVDFKMCFYLIKDFDIVPLNKNYSMVYSR